MSTPSPLRHWTARNALCFAGSHPTLAVTNSTCIGPRGPAPFQHRATSSSDGDDDVSGRDKPRGKGAERPPLPGSRCSRVGNADTLADRCYPRAEGPESKL